MRFMIRAVRRTAAAALVPAAAALAQGAPRPVVVVLPFDNDAVGPAARDFDGVGKGVQDFLITDLASNPAVRLVDRSHVDAVMREQGMIAAGQVDPETAVRLGKILGAQYAVVGGFFADAKGNAVLTGRTIDIETTQIANPERVAGKTDDVLALVTQLSARLAGGMRLAPKPGRGAGGGSGSGNSNSNGTGTNNNNRDAAPTRPPAVEIYAKPVSAKAMSVKLDVAAMKLYANALDEMDKKHSDKAAELFRQVLARFPGFEPAQRHLDRLANAGA